MWVVVFESTPFNCYLNGNQKEHHDRFEGTPFGIYLKGNQKENHHLGVPPN